MVRGHVAQPQKTPPPLAHMRASLSKSQASSAGTPMSSQTTCCQKTTLFMHVPAAFVSEPGLPVPLSIEPLHMRIIEVLSACQLASSAHYVYSKQYGNACLRSQDCGIDSACHKPADTLSSCHHTKCETSFLECCSRRSWRRLLLLKGSREWPPSGKAFLRTNVWSS